MLKIQCSNECCLSFPLAIIFSVLALPTVLFLASMIPPFQGPDELHHFYRAFQVAEGGLLGRQPGLIDPAVRELELIYTDIRYHKDTPTNKRREWRSSGIRWSQVRKKARFANTAAYTPLHYLPQAGGILLGKMLHLNVRDTLLLSRMCTGLFAVVVGALALCICGRGKFLLFTVLLLPMSLSLYASANQGGTLIPVTALAVGVLSRVLSTGRAATTTELVVLAGALLFVVLGRPPYAPFLLVFLLPGLIAHPRAPWIGLGLIAALCGLVLLWYLPQAFEHACSFLPQTDIKKQCAYLIRATGNDALFVFKLLWNTCRVCAAGYDKSFIGYLGWMDTIFPHTYYTLANLALLAAVGADVSDSPYREKASGASKHVPGRELPLFCIGMLAAGGLFFAEYLMGTEVGASLIAGVQGRYFIPIVLFLSLSLPRWSLGKILQRVCACSALAFPLLVTPFYLPATIVYRYYLSL